MAIKVTIPLITFGCSWTYGVGVGYNTVMDSEQYKKIGWNQDICDSLSFRGLLSEKYFLKNKNFSSGGSSNQRQFRLAREFFSSRRFKELQNNYDKILVLWGITSTARNEVWSTEQNQLQNFFYSDEKLNLSKFFTKFCYSHENEIRILRTEMRHWNTFFKNSNIDNLWFDTFNHHDYNAIEIEHLKPHYDEVKVPSWPNWRDFSKNQFNVASDIFEEIMDPRWPWPEFFYPVDNLIFNDENPRDLLSKLAIKNKCQNVDNRYHMSDWEIDTNRVGHLVNCGILNPHSHHPTRQGHEQITEMLSPYIEALL